MYVRAVCRHLVLFKSRWITVITNNVGQKQVRTGWLHHNNSYYNLCVFMAYAISADDRQLSTYETENSFYWIGLRILCKCCLFKQTERTKNVLYIFLVIFLDFVTVSYELPVTIQHYTCELQLKKKKIDYQAPYFFFFFTFGILVVKVRFSKKRNA